MFPEWDSVVFFIRYVEPNHFMNTIPFGLHLIGGLSRTALHARVPPNTILAGHVAYLCSSLDSHPRDISRKVVGDDNYATSANSNLSGMRSFFNA